MQKEFGRVEILLVMAWLEERGEAIRLLMVRRLDCRELRTLELAAGEEK